MNKTKTKSQHIFGEDPNFTQKGPGYWGSSRHHDDFQLGESYITTRERKVFIQKMTTTV
jgi:hypothetical protein